MRVFPVRKRIPARLVKFADQFSDRRPSITKHFHQPLQTGPVPLVPLFRNLGRTPPDGVLIHLLCPGQCGFECLPSRDTLVDAIVRVDAAQRIVWEAPFAGIKAVPLVNEGCGVSLASWRFPTEDRK